MKIVFIIRLLYTTINSNNLYFLLYYFVLNNGMLFLTLCISIIYLLNWNVFFSHLKYYYNLDSINIYQVYNKIDPREGARRKPQYLLCSSLCKWHKVTSAIVYSLEVRYEVQLTRKGRRTKPQLLKGDISKNLWLYIKITTGGLKEGFLSLYPEGVCLTIPVLIYASDLGKQAVSIWKIRDQFHFAIPMENSPRWLSPALLLSLEDEN